MQGLTGLLDLFLLGGFQDRPGQGEKIVARLFRAFEQHPARVRLQLACVGCLNTGAAGEPRCASVAFDTARRAVQPGTMCTVMCIKILLRPQKHEERGGLFCTNHMATAAQGCTSNRGGCHAVRQHTMQRSDCQAVALRAQSDA